MQQKESSMFQLLAHVAVFQEKVKLFHDDLRDRRFTHFNVLVELNRSFVELDIDHELLTLCVQFLEKLKTKIESRFSGMNQMCKQDGHLWLIPFW